MAGETWINSVSVYTTTATSCLYATTYGGNNSGCSSDGRTMAYAGRHGDNYGSCVRGMEDFVTWAVGSKIKQNIMKYRDQLDNFDLSRGNILPFLFMPVISCTRGPPNGQPPPRNGVFNMP